MDKKALYDQVLEIEEEIIENRRIIHSKPELGMDLDQTKNFVYRKLKDYGLEPEWLGKAGVTALVGKKKSKVIMLRADMDALPIEEETGLSFASENKYMHACGHDTHTAMLLGAAKLLKDNEDKLEGQVKLLFQGGEEVMEGAKDALEAGVLENPKVDAAFMIHVATGFEAPHGLMLMYTHGACYASTDWFNISIEGKGGHGSMPNLAVDPNSIMAEIHHSIQQFMAMGLDPREDKVCSIGIMRGGDAENVIPHKAFMGGTVRTFNNDIRNQVVDYITRASKDIAELKGGRAEIQWFNSAPPLFVDSDVSNTILGGLRDMFGQDMIIDASNYDNGKYAKVMGSEDFSYYAELVPSTVINLSAGAPSQGYEFYAHHPKTDFDESVFKYGSLAYAYGAMTWLKENK